MKNSYSILSKHIVPEISGKIRHFYLTQWDDPLGGIAHHTPIRRGSGLRRSMPSLDMRILWPPEEAGHIIYEDHWFHCDRGIVLVDRHTRQLNLTMRTMQVARNLRPVDLCLS